MTAPLCIGILDSDDIGREITLSATLADPQARTGDIRGGGSAATLTEAVLRNLAR
jgi:hypothetical protein